jgi:hypothetical protein
VMMTTHPPSRAEVKNEYISSPPCCLHGVSGTALLFTCAFKEYVSPYAFTGIITGGSGYIINVG